MFRNKLQLNYTHSGTFLSLEKESIRIPLEFGVFFFKLTILLCSNASTNQLLPFSKKWQWFKKSLVSKLFLLIIIHNKNHTTREIPNQFEVSKADRANMLKKSVKFF
jgi:hypothetical protein